jgi:predicted DCC family thiol-disulfide oxidoreductase YuxK
MVIAFDGKCGLCDGFVRFLLRHDHDSIFQFASSTSQQGEAIYRHTGQDPDQPSSVVLLKDDSIFLESESAIGAAIALGGVLRLAGTLMWLPRSLRDTAYRYVARNRFRWFGQQSTCDLPESGWSGRFQP